VPLPGTALAGGSPAGWQAGRCPAWDPPCWGRSRGAGDPQACRQGSGPAWPQPLLAAVSLTAQEITPKTASKPVFWEGIVCSELSQQSLGWTEGLACPRWGLGRILLMLARGMALPALLVSTHRAEGETPPAEAGCCHQPHKLHLPQHKLHSPFPPLRPSSSSLLPNRRAPHFQHPCDTLGLPGAAARAPAGGMASSGSEAVLSRAARRLSSGLCQDLGVTSQERCL